MSKKNQSRPAGDDGPVPAGLGERLDEAGAGDGHPRAAGADPAGGVPVVRTASQEAAARPNARTDPYRIGVEMGREWASGQCRKLYARPFQLNRLREFWRESAGRGMFWFRPARGWEYRDYLYIAMYPWHEDDLSESAAFWQEFRVGSLSHDARFLTGLGDGAVWIAGPDQSDD